MIVTGDTARTLTQSDVFQQNMETTQHARLVKTLIASTAHTAAIHSHQISSESELWTRESAL